MAVNRELESAKTVCVVGNGPSALDRHLGEKIDAHDVVVRCNNYVTESFGDFVGNRTDVWVNCGWSTRDRPFRDYKMILIPNNVGINQDDIWRKQLLRYLDLQEKAPNTRLEFMRCANVNWIRLRAARKFSAGAAAVGWFAFNNPGAKISIVGFDHFQGRGLHHYMDDQTRPNGCPHNGPAEARFFASLEEEGVLQKL